MGLETVPQMKKEIIELVSRIIRLTKDPNQILLHRWEWMISTQLGRRNLDPVQRVAVVKKFEKEIKEQAKSTQGTRTDLTSSPIGEKVNNIHTDKELAKMAGVGTGTIARYNRVMNSGDNRIKYPVTNF